MIDRSPLPPALSVIALLLSVFAWPYLALKGRL